MVLLDSVVGAPVAGVVEGVDDHIDVGVDDLSPLIVDHAVGQGRQLPVGDRLEDAVDLRILFPSISPPCGELFDWVVKYVPLGSDSGEKQSRTREPAPR